MMLRIREAESTQAIGDLRQRIAELEVQVRNIAFQPFSTIQNLESRTNHTWSNYGQSRSSR